MYALDTNILVYAYDKSENLSEQAINLINPNACVSNFVFQEFIFQLTKRKVPKVHLMKVAIDLLDILWLTRVDKDIYRHAYFLIRRCDFSLEDAIVVADAVLNNCNVLYSRDMQNGQMIDKKLRIINPFR
ncbi:PIN domain-containing protein [Parapedobacter sp. DT-150]|uniref:PIN domain-containing protein n=1 Tax=Parapedobacter sp. DT-150 TaxID=3396162 RepID=UPI003F1E3C19